MRHTKCAGRMLAIAAASVLGGMASQAPAALTLNKLWSIGPGTADARTYLGTGNNERGIAYNPATNHVYVVSRATDATSTPANLRIAIVDATNGAHVGFLPTDATINNANVSGTTFLLNKIGVSDDNKIYAANLTTTTGGGGAVKIYRWDNESSAPALVMNQTGLSLRFGDTMDIRGAGANTQILLGHNSTASNVVDLVTTADGNAFTGTIVPVTGSANGDSRHGVAFADGNTFYIKPNASSTNMRRVGFDLSVPSATVLNSYPTTDFSSAIGPIDIDPVNKRMAALVLGATNKLQIFDIADPSVTPVLLGEINLDPQPGNTNANGAGDVRFSPDGYTVYVMQTNNSLSAISIPEPASLGLVSVGALGLIARRRRD